MSINADGICMHMPIYLHMAVLQISIHVYIYRY